jgi:hypothetical protein
MSEYPRINTGLGELTPELWDRLMDVMKFVEGAIDLNEDLSSLVDAGNRPKQTFVAIITGSTEVGDNKYKYEWGETTVELSGSILIPATTIGQALTHTDVGFAYNLCEIDNDASNVGAGVDVADANYPSGFSMMPIGTCGDDTEVGVAVVMTLVRGKKGDVIPVFSMANAHDGDCS